MRNIVFLFGAGASFGAGSIRPDRPPLGFQLYSELELSYPTTWGSLPADIKVSIRRDFESGMQLIYDSQSFAIPQLMREMAVYFIQFRPSNRATLYCKLIECLDNHGLLKDTLFSTLNYECVLEFSLLEGGYALSYFDEGDEVSIPVWKLHGSCNMFSHGVQAGPGVGYGSGVVWEGGLQAFVDPNKVIEHCLVETGLAPAMSLYMRGKPLAISPSVVQELQVKWNLAVQAADIVFVVGVRPMVADGHIWEPLARTPAQLMFVGDEAALNDWKDVRTHHTVHLGSTFAAAFSRISDEVTRYAA